MEAKILEILEYLLKSLPPVVLLLVLLLFFPEKIEKWSALLWRAVSAAGGVFRAAHKQYVKHDLQGRVNDFVRTLRRQVPGIGQEKLRIQWVDPKGSRDSFITDNKIVLRLRRDDPDDHNFVHGAFLFVSASLLTRMKRYLAPSQREAVDLFVTSKLIEKEKPSIVGYFLDQYLHPKTEAAKSKVSAYVDDFAQLDRGAVFFPVFVQELEFLGAKVFGRRRDNLVHADVKGLISFLKPIARREIGDENDMNFKGSYCKFEIVIIGKPSKLMASVEPYVRYIQNEIVPHQSDTIYLLSRKENRQRVEEILSRFARQYECVRRTTFPKVLKYKSGKAERALQYLAVLRRQGVELVEPSE